MEGRNENDYTAVFSYIRNVLQIKPISSMSDYEKAMRNALRKVFVEKLSETKHRTIQVSGCYFHFTQVNFWIDYRVSLLFTVDLISIFSCWAIFFSNCYIIFFFYWHLELESSSLHVRKLSTRSYLKPTLTMWYTLAWFFIGQRKSRPTFTLSSYLRQSLPRIILGCILRIYEILVHVTKLFYNSRNFFLCNNKIYVSLFSYVAICVQKCLPTVAVIQF